MRLLRRAVLILLIVFFTLDARAACPDYLVAPTYPDGGAAGIAAGDLNGDGRTDLTTGGALFGNGDGTFTPGSYGQALDVAMGDLNGDGKPDLAMVFLGVGLHYVTVRFGIGDGRFGGSNEYFAGSDPRSLTLGDLNGDGKNDLAVALEGDDRVGVLINNGNGTFQTVVVYAVGGDPHGIAIGDFNGDGKRDLVNANRTSDSISILLGNGNGTFAPATSRGVGDEPFDVATGDFNGDGKSDVAVANAGSGNVWILIGNASGVSSQMIQAARVDLGSNDSDGTHIMGRGVLAVTVSDFDADGKADMAVTHSWNLVTVRFGNGDLGFGSQITYGTGGQGAREAAAGDFNGDGKNDLAVVNKSSSTVGILINRGDRTFAAQRHYTGPFSPDNNAIFNSPSPFAVAMADINGDGVSDLVSVGYYFNNGSVSIALGQGNGSFGARQFTGSGHAFIAADFNNDGRSDLAVSGSPSVRIYHGQSDGSIVLAAELATGSYSPGFVVKGDFNGDGHVDLVTTSAGGQYLSIFLGHGNGTFDAALTHALGATPGHVAAADFDADGKLDLALVRTTAPTLAILKGNGNGTFAAAVGVTTRNDVVRITTADFNGDGKIDLAAASRHVSVLLNQGNGTFTTSWDHPAFNVNPALDVAAGDFDGDQKQDVAVTQRSSSGEPKPFVIYRGDGTGTFTLAVTYGNAFSFVTPAGDVNGDGRIDLAIGSDSEFASSASTAMLLSQPCRAVTTTALSSFPTQSSIGQSVQFTATVTSGTAGTLTGTVFFKDGSAVIGTGVVSGGQAVFSTTLLAEGTHSISAYYGGDAAFLASTSAPLSHFVASAPFGPPPGVVATASSTTRVSITHASVADAATYEVFRSANNSPYALVLSSASLSHQDEGLSPDTTYLYKVRAVHTSSLPSEFSAPDAATTIVFTDALAAGVTIKALHLAQLRTAVNAFRASAGLAPVNVTDASPATLPVRAIHVQELRDGLGEVRSILGFSAPVYTDPTIAARVTLIRAAQLQQLRDAVK